MNISLSRDLARISLVVLFINALFMRCISTRWPGRGIIRRKCTIRKYRITSHLQTRRAERGISENRDEKQKEGVCGESARKEFYTRHTCAPHVLSRDILYVYIPWRTWRVQRILSAPLWKTRRSLNFAARRKIKWHFNSRERSAFNEDARTDGERNGHSLSAAVSDKNFAAFRQCIYELSLIIRHGCEIAGELSAAGTAISQRGSISCSS